MYVVLFLEPHCLNELPGYDLLVRSSGILRRKSVSSEALRITYHLARRHGNPMLFRLQKETMHVLCTQQ